MFDRILALAALLAFGLFAGVLAYYVNELDLTIVIVVGVAMAAIDFIRMAMYGGSKSD